MNRLEVFAPCWIGGLGVVCLVPILLLVSNVEASEATVRASIDAQSATEANSVKSQKNIDRLVAQTSEALGEYRVATQSLDRIRVYNQHLQKLVNDQEQEKTNMLKQLDDAVVVEQEIIPLMLNMIDSLEQFIRLDMPFQPDERKKRVADLKQMMDKADVTVSEKYRRIMGAYQIETDFGRTVEAYVGNLTVADQTREVDFFRVGRLLLAYQTHDRSETGFWNKKTIAWETLDDEYRNFVTEGLRIARKQAAPDLLKLPVPAPEAAQ